MLSFIIIFISEDGIKCYILMIGRKEVLWWGSSVDGLKVPVF
jgi:hypothetical protein